VDAEDMLSKVEPEDLLKFGFIREFIGRIPIIAALQELSEATLVRILTEPRNALVKQYQKLFEMEGVILRITGEALSAIAKEAGTAKIRSARSAFNPGGVPA